RGRPARRESPTSGTEPKKNPWYSECRARGAPLATLAAGGGGRSRRCGGLVGCPVLRSSSVVVGGRVVPVVRLVVCRAGRGRAVRRVRGAWVSGWLRPLCPYCRSPGCGVVGPDGGGVAFAACGG
ncbi:hypothetical protein RZS08_17470, partial [Arthrospira platensis SPKY1]|nr:hypothetical protein [Arthrospira platensis SPKY1]